MKTQKCTEQGVASLRTAICKSRMYTCAWNWALSDKELVRQLLLQRACHEFTESKPTEDREAGTGVVCVVCDNMSVRLQRG